MKLEFCPNIWTEEIGGWRMPWCPAPCSPKSPPALTLWRGRSKTARLSWWTCLTPSPHSPHRKSTGCMLGHFTILMSSWAGLKGCRGRRSHENDLKMISCDLYIFSHFSKLKPIFSIIIMASPFFKRKVKQNKHTAGGLFWEGSVVKIPVRSQTCLVWQQSF